MNYKKLRDLIFPLHRYIGLVVGLIVIVIGLTGSLLVFYDEMDHFLIGFQTGRIVPQENQVSIESVLDTVRAAYANRPELKLNGIDLRPGAPYAVGLSSAADEDYWLDIFVNPYTGAILGSREWESSFFGFVFNLHYKLLAGGAGEVIAGIAALLLLILCLTGLILWPGWRKLIQGFKIKSQAHTKRVNFDVHKVVGIVATVFLAMTAFTGFCWNFWDYAEPAIYAAAFSPKPVDPVSQPTEGKLPVGLAEILQEADAALPGAISTWISVPTEKDATFQIYKKSPQDRGDYDNSIYLDQYSGEVLRVDKGLEPKSLGDRVVNSFDEMHYGTFWGLPSRILYVFIGLTPTILSITGFVMWKYRYRGKAQLEDTRLRERIEQKL